MAKLDQLIDAWQVVSCPVGGDPVAVACWDRWLDTFWTTSSSHSVECTVTTSHHGLILWHETDAGLLGVRPDDPGGRYWIPIAADPPAQLVDESWFSCCEEDRAAPERAMTTLSLITHRDRRYADVDPALNLAHSRLAPMTAGGAHRIKHEAA